MNRHFVYRFGEFHLDPAARELRQGDRLLELPRLTFDGLAFLVEHRDRAVSRDELIAAVWGRPLVEDIQVTQLIMRVRRSIGDDSHKPQFIRTVSGFGYRWIADTEVLPAPDHEGAEVEPEPSPVVAAVGTTMSAPLPVVGGFRRWQVPALVLAALALITLALILPGSRSVGVAERLPRVPGEAVAVLPVEISAPDDIDAGWARLGTMDLVAARLRESGLPVPPSDSVVSALHNAAGLPAPDQLDAVRRTLGAGVLVQGKAVWQGGQWTIELVATTADGSDRRRIEAGPADIIPAANQSARLLLAAFGREGGSGSVENEALSDLLQRARAANLALELETARDILMEAPESLRREPELRLQRALIELRAGQVQDARTIVDDLLADPALAQDARLHAEALTLRGHLASRDDMDWTSAVDYFDAGVELLQGGAWNYQLGVTLSSRGAAHTFLHQFDPALRDLSQARALLEASGDRLVMVRINNYLGHLEIARGRLTDALPYYESAIDISASFGHVDWLRANLLAQLGTQGKLLRWPDVLATSERLWVLRERIPDPVWQNQIRLARASTLLALGRHQEATSILADIGEFEADLPTQGIRETQQVRAELAWQLGDWPQALQAASRALELWPRSRIPAAPQPEPLLLLHQRASIAVGHAAAAADHEVLATTRFDDDPIYLVARAEWSAHQGDDEQADRWFGEAARQAEQQAVPVTLLQVADARGRWLIAVGRATEALPLAGRVADWVEQDYQAALLQVAIYHANHQREAWANALRRAQSLAGEREIPADLRLPPG